MKIEEIAYNKGYRILPNGDIYKNNKKIIGRYSSTGYLAFHFKIQINGKTKLCNCKAHRLQAYQKFGEAIYGEGIVVRHLNGNCLDNSFPNIEIGTQSQNVLDRPKEQRIKHALHAAKFNPLRYDQKIIESIKRDREKGLSYNELMKKYNITSKGAISYICKHNYIF